MKNIRTSLLLAFAFSLTANGTVIYQISLNTSPLIGNPAGPFSLDFQLLGDQGATAVLDDFQFGPGSSLGSGFCTGICAGDLSGSVTMQAAAGGFFNEFYQAFTPGATLSFRLQFFNISPPASGTPDGFSFAILDFSLFEIPMSGGNGSLVTITLDSAVRPSLRTYTNDPGGSPAIGALGDPAVDPLMAPEPGSFGLLAAVASLVLVRPVCRQIRKTARRPIGRSLFSTSRREFGNAHG